MLAKLAEFFGRTNNGETALARDGVRFVANMVEACHALLSERGEVSGTMLAASIAKSYQLLDRTGQERFFDSLAREFSPDPDEVSSAAGAYGEDPTDENLTRLQLVVEPPRQELFRRLNMAQGGTAVLVQMQGDLLKHEVYTSISNDLGHLLASWFNPGFLVLRRIDWRTSATILEKLIQYEAVHQIQGWEDLRRRLEADRRCYALFHPVLPDEPIIFVEVALTKGMSNKVQPLIDPESPVVRPNLADCAVFYSITNCQTGLRGVPFGSFLLKQVMQDIEQEFPRIHRLATLSPVPGFRAWLTENSEMLSRKTKFTNLAADLAKLEDPGWVQDEAACAELQEILVPLCAHYLLRAKRDKEPIDSVARFHLRNGARLEQINWLGDTSKNGLDRSAGLMVNYVYELASLERNHERYAKEFRVTSAYSIEALVRQSTAAPVRAVR